MELSKLIGVALLGGVAAALTGVAFEVLRAFLDPVRRVAILHRSLRDNFDHFLRSPRYMAGRH
jgi:hypothetical protein